MKRENNSYENRERNNHSHEHRHNHHNNLHSTSRLKALISHWVEHNTGHLEKIEEYAKLAKEEGKSEVAEHLAEAAGHMRKAIEALESALKHA